MHNTVSFLAFLSLFLFASHTSAQNNTACIVAGGITWTGDFTTTYCGVNSTSLCAVYNLVTYGGQCTTDLQCASRFTNPCAPGRCQPNKVCVSVPILNCCNPPSFPCTSPPNACFASTGTCFVSSDNLTRTCRYTELDQDGDGIKCSADCNDTDARVGGPTGWFQDADGDFYGSPRYAVQDGSEGMIFSCTQPPGYSNIGTDCNDNNKWVFPGALSFSNCAVPVQTLPNVNTSYINPSPLTKYGLDLAFDPVIRVMAVGIPGFIPNGSDPTVLNIGAVEIFFRNGSALSATWQQVQFISPPGSVDSNNFTTFGARIGLSQGLLMVVWSIGTNGTTGKSVNAYQQTSPLPTTNPQYAFDASWVPVTNVAVSAISIANVVDGDTIVTSGFDNSDASIRFVWISVRNYNGSGTPRGPTTVGVYNNYTLIQRLTRPNLLDIGTHGDLFGTAIAVLGDIMVIGDPGAAAGPTNLTVGAIYTYLRNASGLWNFYAKISPPGTAAYLSGSFFGSSIALNNNTMLVTCLFCNSNTGGVFSFSYTYSLANGAIPEAASGAFLNMFASPDVGPDDSFGGGLSVDVVQGAAFIAARSQDGSNLQSCGAIDPLTPGRGGFQSQYPVSYPFYNDVECNVNGTANFGRSSAMFTETGAAEFTTVWTFAISDSVGIGNTYIYVCTSLPIFC